MHNYEKELEKVKEKYSKIFVIVIILAIVGFLIWAFILPIFSESVAIDNCKFAFSNYHIEDMTLDEMCHMYHCKTEKCCRFLIDESRYKFCLHNVALKANDISSCYEEYCNAGNCLQSAVDSCLYSFARNLGNITICESIEHEIIRKACMDDFT